MGVFKAWEGIPVVRFSHFCKNLSHSRKRIWPIISRNMLQSSFCRDAPVSRQRSAQLRYVQLLFMALPWFAVVPGIFSPCDLSPDHQRNEGPVTVHGRDLPPLHWCFAAKSYQIWRQISLNLPPKQLRTLTGRSACTDGMKRVH